jgi:hypothetical protein
MRAESNLDHSFQLVDLAQIDRCIAEAEQRIASAIHYRNPYPRPVYLPPNTFAGTYIFN